MPVVDYLIEMPEATRAQRGGRYLARGSWEGNIRCTDDPEQAVIMRKAELHAFAARLGLPPTAYTLVESRPIRAAHRRDLRDRRAKAKRVTEALATSLRARFPGLGVYIGGKTAREIGVTLTGLSIAEFYVDMNAEIVVLIDHGCSTGGIENALWAVAEKLREIQKVVNSALDHSQTASNGVLYED